MFGGCLSCDKAPCSGSTWVYVSCPSCTGVLVCLFIALAVLLATPTFVLATHTPTPTPSHMQDAAGHPSPWHHPHKIHHLRGPGGHT